jgi:hypothetical protein
MIADGFYFSASLVYASMKTLTNLGDYTESRSRIHIPFLQHSGSRLFYIMFRKLAMMLEIQIIFEEVLLFKTTSGILNAATTILRRVSSKNLKISKCFHINKPNFNFYFLHNKGANSFKIRGACIESTDLIFKNFKKLCISSHNSF